MAAQPSALEDDPSKPQHQLDVDVQLLDPAWLEMLPHAEALSAEVVRAVLTYLSPHWAKGRDVEVSIIMTSDDEMQALNNQHRGKDKPTNVLSFAACDLIEGKGDDVAPPGAPVLLGDIVLASGVLSTEASEQNKSLDHHLIHLLVHGTLHLLGYDHIKDAEAESMEKLEADILSGLGVADPYTPQPGNQL